MKAFSKLRDKSVSAIIDWIDDVCTQRQQDRRDFENFSQLFIKGRNRSLLNNRAEPSSSSDVTSTDMVGDIMHTAGYLYILIDNSGTPEWRRVVISSF